MSLVSLRRRLPLVISFFSNSSGSVPKCISRRWSEFEPQTVKGPLWLTRWRRNSIFLFKVSVVELIISSQHLAFPLVTPEPVGQKRAARRLPWFEDPWRCKRQSSLRVGGGVVWVGAVSSISSQCSYIFALSRVLFFL